jgi:hypothetical protein
MSKNPIKAKLSNEIVDDITFFEEDISEMTNQLVSGEDLYERLFDVYDSLTSGKYSNIKSPRDIAEIAKALVQIRSLCSDAAFKRHQIRKNLSDIVYRKTDDEIKEDNVLDVARAIINEVRNLENNNNLNKPTEKSKVLTDDVRKQLDSKVQRYIKSGDITLSTNDKLIGSSEHIQFKFNKNKEKFVAIDGRTGNVISDFPKERLPDNKISKYTNHEVITKNGESYELLGDN